MWAVCRFSQPGVFGYGCGLFCGSGGVLLQNGKDSGAVKVVAQLPGGNGLCPVRREVGKPPPALLDGTPSRSSREEKSSNEAAADSAARMVCRSFSLFVSNLVCRGVIPPAIMGAFCLSSAACPFFCAQYSRSVTRFLLPFKRSIW